MKLIWSSLILLLILIVVYWAISQGGWHLKRNIHNVLPSGELMQYEGNFYKDEAGLIWELQPNSKNIFHQPDKTPVPAPPIPVPYPNILPALNYNPDYPNLKFLSLDGKGGSFEGILQPDGTYLIKGKKQGTFNYANPLGFWGYFKHAVLDVIPHLFNSNYDESLNKVPGIENEK